MQVGVVIKALCATALLLSAAIAAPANTSNASAVNDGPQRKRSHPSALTDLATPPTMYSHIFQDVACSSRVFVPNLIRCCSKPVQQRSVRREEGPRPSTRRKRSASTSNAKSASNAISRAAVSARSNVGIRFTAAGRPRARDRPSGFKETRLPCFKGGV